MIQRNAPCFCLLLLLLYQVLLSLSSAAGQVVPLSLQLQAPQARCRTASSKGPVMTEAPLPAKVAVGCEANSNGDQPRLWLVVWGLTDREVKWNKNDEYCLARK